MSRPDLAPREPHYTDEVQAALRTQAITNRDQVRPVVPAGHVQYLIAVGDSVNEGVSTPTVVAAILRAAADQLDQGETK